jgi:hypothetical protein
VRRSVGQVEETDDVDDMSEGSDDDQSLDFLDATDSTSKMLGPYIPAERRMVLKQIIEKMASVMKEKKNTKVNIIMNWRLARLNEKVKLLKTNNLGFMLLSKVFDKRKNSFYKIAEFGSVRKAGPTTIPSLSNISVDSNFKDGDLQKQLTGTLCLLVESEASRQLLIKEIEGLKATIEKMNKEKSPPSKATGSNPSLEAEVKKLKASLEDKEAEIESAIKDVNKVRGKNDFKKAKKLFLRSRSKS